MSKNEFVMDGAVEPGLLLVPGGVADCRIISFNIAGGEHVLSIDQDGRVLVGEGEVKVHQFTSEQTAEMTNSILPGEMSE